MKDNQSTKFVSLKEFCAVMSQDDARAFTAAVLAGAVSQEGRSIDGRSVYPENKLEILRQAMPRRPSTPPQNESDNRRSDGAFDVSPNDYWAVERRGR